MKVPTIDNNIIEKMSKAEATAQSSVSSIASNLFFRAASAVVCNIYILIYAFIDNI